METRANYVVIGLFTLVVIAGVFGFVFWFQGGGASIDRGYYRIAFDGSVNGLRTGSAVMFNGLRHPARHRHRTGIPGPDRYRLAVAEGRHRRAGRGGHEGQASPSGGAGARQCRRDAERA